MADASLVDPFVKVGSWVIDHGVAGVLFGTNGMLLWLYVRERKFVEALVAARILEQKERVTAEQANSAALARGHLEVAKTISTVGQLVEYLNQQRRR